MKRELLILRHGKSDWNSDSDDFHRTLNTRGKQGAKRIGAWLTQLELIPDIIISSPAQRAMDTAKRACKVMGLATKKIQYDKRLYLADLNTLLKVLKGCPPSMQRVLLVGHNPGLEELLSFLAQEEPDMPEDGKLLPTSTLARLEMLNGWNELAANQARLISITRASALPET